MDRSSPGKRALLDGSGATRSRTHEDNRGQGAYGNTHDGEPSTVTGAARLTASDRPSKRTPGAKPLCQTRLRHRSEANLLLSRARQEPPRRDYDDDRHGVGRYGEDGAVASGKGPRAGQPKRRTFTAAYKARILCEDDQLESGRERGALLRREGLYSSHIDGWRKARDAGAANGMTDKPGGAPGRSTEAVENERLRKENEKLTAELTRTKAALEVVGKAHALLELLSESADSDAKRHK